MDEPEELNEEIDEVEGEEEIESIVSDDDDVEDLQEGIVLDDEQIVDDVDDDDDDDDDDDLEQEEINKEELGELTSIKQDSYKASFIFNDDLEANDSYEFLQKFNKDLKNDFIASNHQECLSKNLDEIKDLMNVIRDKNNIIIDELHKTIPILTKYEKTRILGIRIKQLNNGALPYVKIPEDLLDNFIIAEKELKEKKIPFIIQRPLPNNTFEYWKLEDLEIL
tara:strand:+ start:13566 stop:14234 length:669 start_codon:yes stop_codon:yes gene_type:complete